MTQCPKCNRTYDEDFAFCLEDGTPLKPSTLNQPTLITGPEAPPPTLVMPSPEGQQPTLVIAPETKSPTPSTPTGAAKAGTTAPPNTAVTSRPNPDVSPSAESATASLPRSATIPPVSSALAPGSRKPGAPIVAIVIGVLVVVLVIIVVGAVVVLLLSQNSTQSQTAASNQNSSMVSSAPSADPNATASPLYQLRPNSDPSPTPASSLAPSEGVITAGTYQSESTRKMGNANNKVTVYLRIQIAVNADGTYVSRGYMTLPQANIHDQLGIEERGNYSQSGETIHLTNRKERQFNFDTGSWKGWTTPDDGNESTEKIRNVTPNTFQLFDDEEKQWFTFTRT